MKKTVKKLAALGLTVTSVMGLVACGSKGSDAGNTNTTKGEVTKPGKFTVMVDNTVLAEDNGGTQFYDYMKELTGLDIEWIRPDHNTYYDNVGIAFNSESTMPDVVLLSSDYYSQYASNGLLWDMTEAWENSETNKSGRLISTAKNVLDALLVTGDDGEKAMYGFSPYRGNGCCTFMSVDWLTAAGYKKSDVEGKTLTFKQYYDILKAMKEAKGSASISAPGLISNEAPYTNYLAEFYQKANYTFYYDTASKKYVDGFSDKAMQDALQRIATAYSEGVLDRACITDNTTSKYREKFFQGKIGAYTYWAGTWANTTQSKLKTNGLSTDIVYLEPIQELGQYVERIAPCWCITKHASNPEGIFKYFIDTMLDGDKVQTAWTYGAKGTCWDTKAETVTYGENVKTYEEGTFHFLPQVLTPKSLYSKNHIDAIISLAKFKDGTDGAKGASAIPEIATKNGAWFAGVSKVATPLPMTDKLTAYQSDINDARNKVINKVVTGEMTVDQGMSQYKSEVGSKVEEVLKSLDNLNK